MSDGCRKDMTDVEILDGLWELTALLAQQAGEKNTREHDLAYALYQEMGSRLLVEDEEL